MEENSDPPPYVPQPETAPDIENFEDSAIRDRENDMSILKGSVNKIADSLKTLTNMMVSQNTVSMQHAQTISTNEKNLNDVLSKLNELSTRGRETTKSEKTDKKRSSSNPEDTKWYDFWMQRGKKNDYRREKDTPSLFPKVEVKNHDIPTNRVDERQLAIEKPATTFQNVSATGPQIYPKGENIYPLHPVSNRRTAEYPTKEYNTPIQGINHQDDRLDRYKTANIPQYPGIRKVGEYLSNNYGARPKTYTQDTDKHNYPGNFNNSYPHNYRTHDDEFDDISKKNYENERYQMVPQFRQDNAYSSKLVYETTKYLSSTVTLNLTNSSLMTFLRQFSVLQNDHQVFSQVDYITIINKFTGTDIQIQIGKYSAGIQHLTYVKYVELLMNLKNGFHVCDNDILAKLNEIQAKSLNVVELFLKVVGHVDSVGDKVWPTETKNRHTFYYIKKYMTPALRQSLDTMMKTDYYGEDIYPSQEEVRQFCIRANKNMEMTKSTRGMGVNMIYQQSDNNVSDRMNHIHGSDRILEVKMEKKDKPGSRYEVYCECCERKGYHSTDKCFYHTDPQIAHKNQMRANITNCMLCRGAHMALECPVYPRQSPIYPFCKKCTAKGIKGMHHETKLCKESAEN